jgi:hypothetical protein
MPSLSDYNYSDILSKQGGSMYHSGSIPGGPNAGTPYIIVNYGGGRIEILRFYGADGGSFERAYQLTADEVASVTSDGGSEEEEGPPEDGGGGIPDFKPTGPVYTPLDPAGIAQRDYSAYYPQSYMPTDPAYPTMGLLSTPAFGGTDLYQPWSAQYGANVAPSSLWNYTPPSPLDVSAGPKVTFE